MSERMASKCGGKRRHRSERRAVECARTTQKRTGVAMKAYACEFCKGWHVGAVKLHIGAEMDLPRSERYLPPT